MECLRRVKKKVVAYHPNFVLIGDPNVEFDQPNKEMAQMIGLHLCIVSILRGLIWLSHDASIVG